MNATALTLTGPVHTPGALAPLDKTSLKAQLARLEDPEMLELQNRLAAAYDAACRALIGPNDVQKEGNREFKKKSAWRKLGRHFGISTEIVREEMQLLAEGEFLAKCVVRATAPWGQQLDATGACGSDEEEGRRRITMADAVATAQTRAANRAVSDLVAMGEVSAEEIGDRSARDKDKTATEPELTLEEALAIEFPWRKHAKYSGKPLSEVSTRTLLMVGRWAKAKVENGDASRTVERLYRATVLITESRPDLEATIAAMEKGDDKGDDTATPAEPASEPAPAPAAAPDTLATTPATAAAAEPPSPPTADESARIHERTQRLNTLLKSDRIAPAVQKRVGEQLAQSDLTLGVIEKAIAELENVEIPF